MKKWLFSPLPPLLALLLLALAELCCGTVYLAPGDFCNADGTLNLLVKLRLFRLGGAFAVGSALALSGLLFQAVLRNPLAEPFTLGVSGGAGVGAALAIMLNLYLVSRFFVPLLALGGALCVLLLVLFISRWGRNGSENLLLSGVIAGTVASCILIALVSCANQEELAGVTWWMLGNLQAPLPELLLPLLALTVASGGFVYWRSGDLDALMLGDFNAWNLGISVRNMRIVFVLLAGFLAAGTVALAGLIGFAGLIVPHLVRKLYGASHKNNLVPTLLWGGAFLMLADWLSRIVLPQRELPIGLLTALLGGALFLGVLHRQGRNLSGE